MVTNISWSSWTAQSASGQGTWHYQNCVPDCAQSTVMTPYPATLALSKPANGQFTVLTETQTGPYGHTFAFTLPNPYTNAS